MGAPNCPCTSCMDPREIIATTVASEQRGAEPLLCRKETHASLWKGEGADLWRRDVWRGTIIPGGRQILFTESRRRCHPVREFRAPSTRYVLQSERAQCYEHGQETRNMFSVGGERGLPPPLWVR